MNTKPSNSLSGSGFTNLSETIQEVECLDGLTTPHGLSPLGHSPVGLSPMIYDRSEITND